MIINKKKEGLWNGNGTILSVVKKDHRGDGV